ncbi:hypothetical protein OAO87_02305 [bacterium]|nr:hypothetical protein [bacterium]
MVSPSACACVAHRFMPPRTCAAIAAHKMLPRRLTSLVDLEP